MNNLISVIVPVYKSEKYLLKCVKSILAQSYTNFELILIDDGSPDNCPAICDELAKKDKRIKVIHKENGGVSSARNAGLEVATGKYVTFVDSDDRIKPDYFKNLIDAIINTNSDIVYCGIEEKFTDYNDIIVSHSCIHTKNNNIIETFDDYIDLPGKYKYVIWAKMFKSEFIKNDRFEHMRYCEDSRYMAKILIRNPRICFTPYVGYEYIRWQNSATMNANISNRNLEGSKNWMKICEELICPSTNESKLHTAYTQYFASVLTYLQALASQNNKVDFNHFRSDTFFNTALKKHQEKLSIKLKLYFKCYKILPRLAWTIVQFTNNRL